MDDYKDKCGFKSSAFTIVELLVVTLIVAIFSLFAIPASLRASRMERNLRAEAYVRTQLVLNLERLAREISLANDIEWIPAGGNVPITDSTQLSPGMDYLVRLRYPLETGGVSFETNRIAQVSSVQLRLHPDMLSTTVSNYVDLVPSKREPQMSTDPVFVGSGGDPHFTGFSITNVIVNGEPLLDVFHVTLSSAVTFEAGNGATSCKTVSVDRLVRMWNR